MLTLNIREWVKCLQVSLFLCFHLFSVKYFKNVCINFIVLCIDLLIVPQFAVQKAEVLNSDKKGKQVNEYKQQRL